jgi:hypothetical protein
MWLTLVPITLCLVLLMRTILIMSGFLKGPILHSFEKYGDAETVYYPLPALLLWSGLLVFSIGPWIAPGLRSWTPVVLLGLPLLIAAYYAYVTPQFALKYPDIFFVYPRWYHDLRERTTRYERRRIAYMWLALPAGMRLAYNGNDRAFNQWADLVIMATMTYEEDPDLWRDFSSSGYV